MRPFCQMLACSFLLGAAACAVSTDEPKKPRLPNLVLPTLGAKQLWADERHFHSWRIQRNVVTGHCRLLDGKDFRHAWGSYADCDAKLEQIRRERRLPAMRGKAVVLLHGLGRSRSSMKQMAAYLEKEGGYHVFRVSYPSTRADVATHARRLALVIERLDGIEEIDLVGHSLGNLVIRHYLGDTTDEATGRKPDARLGRIVMLAPPNQGAELGKKLGKLPLYRAILGESGEAFSKNWARLAPHLATPACDFGILAGGRGDARGSNPLVAGDDDLVVSVASTRLAGARDFRVVPCRHTFIMDDPAVLGYTRTFLEHGYFESEAKRQPIEK